MRRVLSVARIPLINWHYAFLWPLGIMTGSFAINLALFASLADKVQGMNVTYGIVSIFFVQLIVCSQGMTQMFNFAVGLSATRRAFYLATGLVVTAQSFAYGIVLYLAKLIEHASHGWGVRLAFFDPIGVTHSNSPAQILVYAVPLLLCSYIGIFTGVVAKRWGGNGIFTLGVLTTLVLGGAVVLVTWTHSWPAVGNWFTSQSALALTVGWVLLPMAALAAAGYGLIRRATP
jgi:hypothetical protein